VLTNLETGSRTVDYSSPPSCCASAAWVRPHHLFFADGNRTLFLDPVTRRVRFVAAFGDFYVSSDGAWVAGYDVVPPREPQFAALVNLENGRCVLLPGPENYVGGRFRSYPRTPATGFSRDGKYVVVAKPHGRAVRYRIASLDDPCPTE
jgi:hypothetical protein